MACTEKYLFYAEFLKVWDCGTFSPYTYLTFIEKILMILEYYIFLFPYKQCAILSHSPTIVII